MMRSSLVSVAVCLAVLCQSAAAQTCPSNVCNAYFADAMGGPMDCCKWDYNKGPCQWAGTPVSFQLVRTCADGAKVLVGGNRRGPASNGECRCNNANNNNANTPTFSAQQVCKKKQTCFTVNPKMNADISGHDIACQGNSFCKVCGGLDAVKNGCADDRRCEAFTFESATGCGFLKSSPNTSKRMGWVSFTR